MTAQAEYDIFNQARRVNDQGETQEIWDHDGMPDRTVVENFYSCAAIVTQGEQDTTLWEAVESHSLDETVPGYPEMGPYAQWRVSLSERVWMIYQWWEGTGENDDTYVYVQIAPEFRAI